MTNTTRDKRFATDPTIRFLKILLTERDLHSGDWDLVWKKVECHEIDVLRPGEGTRVSQSWASSMIDAIRAMPRPPAAAGEVRNWGQRKPPSEHKQRLNSAPAELGVYRKDGRLYVVREFTDDGRTIRYAREIVPLTEGEGDRVDGNGERARIKEVKAPRMQWVLTKADAMSLDDLMALSLQWSHCLSCGHAIHTAASIVDRNGLGPVCYGRQVALVAK